MNERVFNRQDWLWATLAALAAMAGYAWTAAPSVTLLDSGEFIVAAQHFGVPHPTGYPLWTLLAWLFQLIPLGNVAWQLALFSGVCGALAVGLATLLIRSSARWMLPALDGRAAGVIALSLGLVFAFSFSMWSQAVIVEVYTLHALLIGLYLTSLYAWIRRPEKLAGMYWSFFTLTLAFSNHQLAIVFAVVPLQFLVVLLLRRDLFWDLLLALLVCALIAYLSFAMLSDDPVIIRAAVRLGYLLLTILAIALVFKRGRLHWRLVSCLPFVLALGLLPYLYMPFASATNPPMNWGYARTAEGFFYSFNRSQYPGTLAQLSLRLLSNVLGVTQAQPAGTATGNAGSMLNALAEWTGFFWLQILRGFLPLAPLFLLAALLGMRRGTAQTRAWITLLVIAFAVAMALQPVLEHAGTDSNAWWLQMPYHTYTNFLLAVICGIGACFAWQWIVTRAPRLRPAIWAALLLPLWPIWLNCDGASQRGRWFGWQYGYDMLRDLPRGSVIFGGTDPGRFIPTYLIFGESTLPPSRRVEPAFDRGDLYILTQNGLTDRYYLAYIHDQYSSGRPRAQSPFEHWLGRDNAYPKKSLILPSLAEMQQIRQKVAADARAGGRTLSAREAGETAIAAVAKWIFEKNKGAHSFYVEESFVMKWSYDYAVPAGLLYRINPEPLAALPADAVRRDFQFWNAYIARLKANPGFEKDFDAKRSFSRLRVTGGEIYEHRGLLAEAEKAYRESLDLWTGSTGALAGLARILWKRGDFDGVIALYRRSLNDDPNSRELQSALAIAEERKKTQAKIDVLLAAWRKNPPDIDSLEQTLSLAYRMDEDALADAILIEALGKVGSDPGFLHLVVRLSEAQSKWQQSADAASRWVAVQPDSMEAQYRLARALFVLGEQKESLRALEAAIRLDGMKVRERLFNDPAFQALKDLPEFKNFMIAPPPKPRTDTVPVSSP